LPSAQPRIGSASINEAQHAFANGDVATAERICSELVARSADNGAAWALLTETALQRGRPDAAIVCADRAVALMPKDPIPLILRAKCLFVSGEARRSFEAAEAAAKLVGHVPEALDACGAIFGLLGLHKQAKEMFRRAVAARPGVPQYLFNLAATERMTGALEQAEAHCDAAIALDRHYGLAHYLRSDLRIQTADRNHVEEMETLIHGGRLTRPSEVMLRFALGKDHVEAGCDLQHRWVAHYSAA
jgi:tetratricopeptide (TPR) repeat protein